jgi:hypothetical protein
LAPVLALLGTTVGTFWSVELLVRLMTQSSWPFEINDAADEDDPNNDGDVDADRVVYICEGQKRFLTEF